MTKTLEIISMAYRESNLTAIGAQPSAPQITEALSLLNGIVSSVYGAEVGDPLEDWPVGAEIDMEGAQSWSQHVWAYPHANARLIMASTTAQDVYLPPDPSDGARIAVVDPMGRLAAAPLTVHGNGRAVMGQQSHTFTAIDPSTVLMYRADVGAWVAIATLAALPDEEFSFPQDFDEYFITRLAMRINPRYGRSLTDESRATLEMARVRLLARYKQYRAVMGDPGYCMPVLVTGGAYQNPTGFNGDRPGRFSRWSS